MATTAIRRVRPASAPTQGARRRAAGIGEGRAEDLGFQPGAEVGGGVNRYGRAKEEMSAQLPSAALARN
jgi:hypothetical protein